MAPAAARNGAPPRDGIVAQLAAARRELAALRHALAGQSMHGPPENGRAHADEERARLWLGEQAAHLDHIAATLQAIAEQEARALDELAARDAYLRGSRSLLAAFRKQLRAAEGLPAARQTAEPVPSAATKQRWEQDAYRTLIGRVREIVEAAVPAGSTVLMVSRGDGEFLKVHGRRAWHFPRDAAGGYAGHYPADSDAAIRHMEDLRGKGATHLLFPATAFWWFESYPDFALHMEQAYRVVAREEGVCVIFRLGGEAAQAAAAQQPGAVDDLAYRAVVRQLHDLVNGLLPVGAILAVISKGDPALIQFDGRPARHFPPGERDDWAGPNPANSGQAIALLEAARAGGAQYLIIPRPAFWWFDHYPEFRDYLAQRYRIAVRQEYVGIIVALTTVQDRAVNHDGLLDFGEVS